MRPRKTRGPSSVPRDLSETSAVSQAQPWGRGPAQPGGLGDTGTHGSVRPRDTWLTFELRMGVSKGQSKLPAVYGNSAAPRQEGGEGFEERRWNL